VAISLRRLIKNLWFLATDLNYRSTIFASKSVGIYIKFTKRSQAVAKIADRTSCQWPSGSSKVNDFELICQGVCHLLSVINSNHWPYLSPFLRCGQFSVENAHFSYPFSINPQFENVPLEVNGWNFARPSFWPMANYSRKKFSLRPCPLAAVHSLQTADRRTIIMSDNSSAVT